jgi:hypothetical protein
MARMLIALAIAAAAASGCAGGDGATPGKAGGREQDPGEDLLIVSREGWETDFSQHVVPLVSFQSGGPGKDGIPAIDRPRLSTVPAASRWLEASEPVIEVTVGGRSRAYPLQILIWHEIVNDRLGGRPIAVTYCPLCNSALAFNRRLGSRTLSFGTTGNLRNYDLVMYDRQTESWWQQFDGTAVVGALAGERLGRLPAPMRSWREFARDHPRGTVLSRDTGYRRPYGSNPYVGLDEPPRSRTECGLLAVLGSAPTCPTSRDGRLPLRARVVLIERAGEDLVIPFRALRRTAEIGVNVGGERLDVSWHPGQRSPFPDAEGGARKQVGSAVVRSSRTGRRLPASTPFWFAVAAFHPGIRIWMP